MSQPRRWAFFVHGLLCYGMFVAVFAYAAGFIGDFAVPRTIDRGPRASAPAAVAINLLLLAAFAVQHSVMARPAFKRWWTRIVPPPIERSTYVLASNLVMLLLFWQWRPIEAVVWDVSSPGGRAALWSLFVAGWLLVFTATTQLNHFELFGLRQVWLCLRREPYGALPFELPAMYRVVRHPLYVGWITAFWATPTMTAGHLLFASVATAYILVAIRLEERNLVEHHGRPYAEYRRRVPMLIPAIRRGRRDDHGSETAEAASA